MDRQKDIGKIVYKIERQKDRKIERLKNTKIVRQKYSKIEKE